MPEYLVITLAFLSVAPYLLLINIKAPRVYGAWLGTMWARVETRMNPEMLRLFSLAVWLGLIGGFLSTYLVEAMARTFFPDFQLAFRPTEPLAWVVQIAFIQAGLFEELAKCAIALLLCWLLCTNTYWSNFSPDVKNEAHPVSENQASVQTRALSAEHMFVYSAPFVCAGVGLGFALRENYQYILIYGGSSPAGIFLGRTFASCVHMLINLNFGLALIAIRRGEAAPKILQALLVAVLIHGVYDFFAIPPVAFASMLAYLSFCLLLVYVLRRMHILMPFTKRRTLQAVGDLQQDPLARGAVENFFEREAAKSHHGTRSTLGQNFDRFDTGGTAGRSDPVNAGDRSEADAQFPGYQDLAGSEEWMEMVNQLREPGEYMRNWFLEHPHSDHQPAAVPAPITLADLHLSDELQSFFQSDSSALPMPEKWKRSWTIEQEIYEHNLGRPMSIWSTAVFAGDPAIARQDLAAIHIQLTDLSPLRVLEYYVDRPAGADPEASSGDPQAIGSRDKRAVGAGHPSKHPYWLYVSQGLRPLYGTEFCLRFAHPYPGAKLLFLYLAARLPDQAPWLRNFVPEAVKDSHELGEGQDWLRAMMPVPVFGSLRKPLIEAFPNHSEYNRIAAGENIAAQFEDPLVQLLLLTRYDAVFVASAGVQAFFQTLYQSGQSWQNDLQRPPLSIQ